MRDDDHVSKEMLPLRFLRAAFFFFFSFLDASENYMQPAGGRAASAEFGCVNTEYIDARETELGVSGVSLLIYEVCFRFPRLLAADRCSPSRPFCCNSPSINPRHVRAL